MSTQKKQEKNELRTISMIAMRGLPVLNTMLEDLGMQPMDQIDMMMDVEYTHAEIPLDLEKFLASGDGDFNHDISGIYANFNRTTRQMDNCFLPRCAKES